MSETAATDSQPATTPQLKPKALANGIDVWCQFEELVPVGELKPNPRNPNTHPDTQIELLAKNIRYLGWRHSVLVSKRSGMIAAGLGPASIRRKLAAVSSLYEYLCDRNALSGNPVDGVKRPAEGTYEGKTPALSDQQARALLDAPDTAKPKGIRDAAIIAALLYSGMRVGELCGLRVRDIEERRGAKYFRIFGKRSKIRYVLVHPIALGRIHDYLETGDHAEDYEGPLFRPIRNNRTGELNRPLDRSGVFALLRKYGLQVGIPARQLSPHVLRTTLITNALEHSADIVKVQALAGHSNISTTRLYDRREQRPEDSPVNLVVY